MKTRLAPLPAAKPSMEAYDREERDVLLRDRITHAKASVDRSEPGTLAMPHMTVNKKKEVMQKGTACMTQPSWMVVLTVIACVDMTSHHVALRQSFHGGVCL